MIAQNNFPSQFQPTALGRIKVICGCHEQQFAVAGYSVAIIQLSLQEVFNISPEAMALVNGSEVGHHHRLGPGDTLEFMRRWGRKGGMEPEELARLEQIEFRLRQIESQMPILASFTDAAIHVAEMAVGPGKAKNAALKQEWYFIKDVCQLAGFQPYTLTQACNLGVIPEGYCRKARNGRWQISRAGVEWIRQKKENGEPLLTRKGRP